MTMEPLVLVPPMLCDARIFAPQIAAFSRRGPVVHMPTHLGERMEEIASNILSLAPPTFALAGLSMGGAVALEILRRAPERVTRVALIDSTSGAETPQAASAREPLIVAARSGRFADVIDKEMNPAWLAAGPSRMQVMQVVTDMAHALGAGAYVRQARAMQRRRDQGSTLRKIRQPCVVICGEDDALYPVKRHAFMAELIPGAQLEVIAGAGHLPTLEQPEAVNLVLRDWMARPLVLR